MVNKQAITEVVFAAIDETNLELPADELIRRTADAPLTGPGGQLDSLGVISFMIAVENELEGQLGVTVALSEEILNSPQDDPFQRVDTLVDFILGLCERKKAA
jgi:hypothetical protein